MKRLKPDQRGWEIEKLMNRYWKGWLCQYGEWNRDKLFTELRGKIKERLDERKKLDKGKTS